jgi:D-alanyl-D-alanine carboxypeptidase/D-alanyl-D-alanine-endopeptidase (penicillin-binding protein 4)
MKRSLWFGAVALVFSLGASAQEGWPTPVFKALRAANIPTTAAAALVQEVDSRRYTMSVNHQVAMNPASVMKLVTAYAALELLGPAYRWKTEAYLDGVLREGVLEGNLVLKGYGDPRLNHEAFWMLLRALRGKGLREIRGDLVLDRSHFERVAGDTGRFDGDAFRPYNVLPDALLVNFKSLRFAFLAEPERGAVRLAVDPRPPALEVVNLLKLSEGPCPEGRAFRDLLKPAFDPGKQRATFSGQYPVNCFERDLNVALLEANDHVGGLFRQLWTEIDGVWNGTAREGTASPGARLFHTHESPVLAEVVRDMNKFSNNVIARQIFLTIGAETAGAPARADAARRAVQQWLAAKGIAAPELVLDNGSGLSRSERISAASLASLLQAAWRSNVMPEFIASLPVAAIDGTMRRRLKNEGIAGNAHIKTGLLSDARAMAGYVRDAGGRRHSVVMLVNHPNAHQAQAALDSLLRWVYEPAQ